MLWAERAGGLEHCHDAPKMTLSLVAESDLFMWEARSVSHMQLGMRRVYMQGRLVTDLIAAQSLCFAFVCKYNYSTAISH